MEHQKCYIFEPVKTRNAKRRRSDSNGFEASWTLREGVYEDAWAKQRMRVEEVFESVDEKTIQNVIQFIDNCGDIRRRSKIPTGLVLAGPNIAAHGPFFQRLSCTISARTRTAFVLLSSAECTNLKSLLKHLIASATKAKEDLEDDGDDAVVRTSRSGARLLNYDLQILHDWFKKQNLDHVAVAFQDSEAFDGGLLADVIELFGCWLDRIPFVLLFGLATSVETFHEKLRPGSAKGLEGQRFDVARADDVFEQVFWSTVSEKDLCLRLGPSLGSLLLDRQHDHIQSPQAFSDALQYAYMSHFYANPLSILLHKDLAFKDVPVNHFEALRNLPSFRQLAESLLDNGEARLVKNLLESDAELFRFAKNKVLEAQSTLFRLVKATEALHALRTALPKLPPVRRSTLYIKAVSGQLNSSAIVRDALLSVKVASSDTLKSLLDQINITLGEYCPEDVIQTRLSLDELIKSDPDKGQPLRSEHDTRQQTLRTTVVAQKVELSKKKSTLTKQDTAYSKLVQEFHGSLESYFSKAFIDTKDMFLQEILLYDLKSPHRDVFMPRPRFSIERALSSPHDYLNCHCCRSSGESGDAGGGLSPSQPGTAILYQLYLESGSLVNVADLWSAFNAILGEDGEEEPSVMALFQRSLAELKYLGLIKASRKKTDHVSKLAWKGL